MYVPMGNLTTKQDNMDAVQVFCLQYLQHFDYIKAWEKAHPNKKVKHPRQAAHKFYKTQKVQDRLKELAAEFFDSMEQDVRDIIEETKRIAAFNPLDMMEICEITGEPKLDLRKLKKENPDMFRLMNVEFGTNVTPDGVRIPTYKLKPQDKMNALEKLYKYHNLYHASLQEDNHRPIQVNVQFPIPGSNWKSNKATDEDVIDSEPID